MLILIKRLQNKIMRSIRSAYFREFTNSNPKNLHIGGKIHLINKNIICGDNVMILPGVQFFGDGPIVIGNNTMICNNTMIYASKDAGVTIGNDVLVAAGGYIIDNDHGMEYGELIRKQPCTVAPVKIGNDVWLGTKVTVARGSTIDDGAVIGAMSLVKGSIPKNATAFGIPAKVKRFRNDE